MREIISAKEIRLLTKENEDKNIKRELRRIMFLIKLYAKRGRYEFWLDESPSKEVKKILIDKGYSIHRSIVMLSDAVEISWREGDMHE